MSGNGPRDTTTSSLWVAVSSVDLPDKKYFKIGEVAQLVGVEPHVLRYWQTQFPQVRPQKSRSGHRLYRRRDVETLLAIRELLHVQRFTIAGARQALRSLPKSPSTLPTPAPAAKAPGVAHQAASRPVEAFRALSEQARVRPVEEVQEVEQVEIEVEGLDDDELRGALDRQLAEARGSAIEAVEIEPLEIEAVGGGDMGPASAEIIDGGHLGLDPVDAHAVAASSSVDAEPRPSRAAVAQVATAPRVAETTQPVAPAEARRARRRGEQLGFGFLPSSKSVLEAARAEVLAILEALDREEAESRRRLGVVPMTRAES